MLPGWFPALLFSRDPAQPAGEITVIDFRGQAVANGADVTLTFGAALQQNDVVYVWGGYSATVDNGKGPTTAGYTQLKDVVEPSVKGGIWRKVMGGTPDTNVVCEGGGDANSAVGYGCYVLRGVDTTTPEDAAITEARDSSANPDAPSITTVSANALVLALAVKGDNDGVHTGPTGYSNNVDAGVNDINDFSIGGATKVVATPGAENPPAWADWSGNDLYVAWSVAVRPA